MEFINIAVDEVQAQVLVRLLNFETINQDEKRELIGVNKTLRIL